MYENRTKVSGRSVEASRSTTGKIERAANMCVCLCVFICGVWKNVVENIEGKFVDQKQICFVSRSFEERAERRVACECAI